MEPYSEAAANTFKLNSYDDWLRKRQGLALPVLPPTTPEARKYFFTEIRIFAKIATDDKKKKVDFEAFAQEWNRTADGKERFYVTFEVLSAYAKTWEKSNNAHASQELISSQLQEVKATAEIFLALKKPFPSYLLSKSCQIQPSRSVVELEQSEFTSSLSTEIAVSQPFPQPPHIVPVFAGDHGLEPIQGSKAASLTPASSLNEPEIQPLTIPQQSGSNHPFRTEGPEGNNKRRRIVPEDQRKRVALRSCRRQSCRKVTCPGSNDILRCPEPCTVPCKTCGRTEGCRGVDKGRKCTIMN